MLSFPFEPLVFAGLCVSAALALGAPVAAALWVRRSTGAPWLALGAGALTFAVSQLVLRLPWQLALGVWLQPRFAQSPGLLLGWIAVSSATAALFEETGRYVAFHRFLTRERSFRVGLFFGVGHGGLESVLLVGVTLAANAVLYALLGLGVPLPIPAEAQATIHQQFSALTPGLSVLGGVERLSSLCVHVAASLMVLRSVATGQRRFYLLALGYHALANFAGVELTRHYGPWLGELVIAAFAAAGVAFAFSERRRWQSAH